MNSIQMLPALRDKNDIEEKKMTFEQIYILNRALDGEDIYSLPGFSGVSMDELSITMYKDGLVEDGLLENHFLFTEEGLILAKNILDFKNAMKYVTILDIALGLINEKEAIMLQCVNGDYTFTLVGVIDIVTQLTNAFSFLSLDCSEDTGGMQVGLKEFTELYRLGKSNSFSLMTEQGGKTTHDIFFSDGKSIFAYDILNEELYRKSKNGVIELLKERIAV